ncbi:MAG TPA: CpsD/CapB family tyrosine-protein kinase [Natronincola sp.]|nr:CpsD/CapB family tyrosine-protein kinase [Natronincola sp.]
MRKGRKQENGRARLIVHDDPKAVGSEAFRTLRTNLQFTSPDQDLKSILLTSAGPGEGKSTVSANLAVAWSQSGAKVVLVGCDLRKPVLHEMFSIRNVPGLSAVLSGAASLKDAIVSSNIPGLDVIPAGPLPPNPAELLQSKAMVSVIEELEKSYDMVILDGTPVIAVTDAAVMANQVDGIVLVIGSNQVPREMALQAKNLLEQAQAKLLGVIMNKVKFKESNMYYYYYNEVDQAQ